MDAGQFQVDTTYLRRSSNELRQCLQILTNTHGELRDKMIEVGTMWEGPAKDIFHLQFRADCVAFVELCQKIEDTLDRINSAAKEYELCDEHVRNIVDAIRV